MDKAISRLRVGDKVMATDPATGVSSARTVQRVWVNHDRDLMDLSISTSSGVRVVHATQGHLFWDDTAGRWVKARDLAPGDRLRTGDGTTATVASTTVVAGSGDMWDLTIEGLHDFYIQTTNDNDNNVGGGGNVGGSEGDGGAAAADPTQTTILTHNCPVTGGGEATKAVPDPKPVFKSNGAPDRGSPWYVSFRDADGNLQTVGNLDGVHAEARIQQAMPDAPMSKPFGWRTLDSDNGPQWVEGTVCAECQAFPRELFAPGTRGALGGPWGD